MCGTDLRPLSIVRGEGFKNFCKELNPSYLVPSTNTVSKYLHLIYDDLKKEVKHELTNSCVSLTTDLWTSINTRGFITVTAHYVTSQWTLKSLIIATRPVDDKHTGANIASCLEEIKNEFGIQTIFALVTDNAANMLTASQVAGVMHVSCYSHSLQLAINDGLKIASVSRAIAAGRRLVAHFNRSSSATQALIRHQKILGLDNPLHLVQDVSTRWNSTYAMMKRLLTLRIPVYAVIMDSSVTKSTDRMGLDIPDSSWKVMEDITPILEPLAEATQVLTKEDQPTSSAVYIIVKNLWLGLLPSDLDDGAARDLKKAIQTSLANRFKLDDVGEPKEEVLKGPLMTACALDPRYKSLRFISPHKRVVVHDNLLVLMEEINNDGTQNQGTQNTVTSSNVVVKQEPGSGTLESNQSAKGQVLNWLRGDVVDLTGPENSTSHEAELERFISEKVHVHDPLLWWQKNEAQFPYLAKLASKFLGIPATEVASERSFSVAGLTLTKLRATLEPEHVDQIIFIHKNHHFLANQDMSQVQSTAGATTQPNPIPEQTQAIPGTSGAYSGTAASANVEPMAPKQVKTWLTLMRTNRD